MDTLIMATAQTKMMASQCVEVLRIIHETIEVQQGGYQWNQWNQDTAADAKWTNADYQL